MSENICTVLTDAREIASLDSKFLSNFYFRGQANSEWSLSSSLERLVRNHHNRDELFNLCLIYESQMLSDFKWKYPLYEKVFLPALDDNVEWLSLMQHYGACTRLLDFSDSIFVALYMAMQNFYNGSCTIWGVNKNFLNHKLTEQYYREHKECKKAKFTPFRNIEAFSFDFANRFIEHDFPKGECLQQIISIKPKMCNERIARQQGLFLMPTDLSVSFMTNLENTCSGSIYYNEWDYSKFIQYSQVDKNKSQNMEIRIFRIDIHHSLKLGLTKLLSQMNITAETMFPGVSGLAMSVNKLRDGFGDYIE